MKSLNTIQKLSKIGKVLSKIAFIFSVIGFCGCIAGLLSLNFGNGRLIKIGGVTLHGLIPEEYGYNIKSITATLSGWLIVCAGEAVLTKFAESYFKNELKAKTPFTLAGAKKLLQLGILTITIPTACAVAGSIAEGIIAGFMKVKQTEAMDMYFDNESSIVLGIMFILGSLSPVYLLTDHVGFYEHYGCSYVWFKATEKLRCRECTCISNLRQLVCNVSDWRT